MSQPSDEAQRDLCDQCGGYAHICEQPDSTCRFATMARERMTATTIGPREVAHLLREVEGGAWHRLSRARSRELELLRRKVLAWAPILRSARSSGWPDDQLRRHLIEKIEKLRGELWPDDYEPER